MMAKVLLKNSLGHLNSEALWGGRMMQFDEYLFENGLAKNPPTRMSLGNPFNIWDAKPGM